MHIHRHIRMTPMERAAGRLMRAPDHPTEGDDTNSGADSGTTGNNQPGNSGDSSTTGGDTGNNSGQSDELNSFWQEPAQEGDPPNDSNNEGETGTTLGQTLLASIDSFAPAPLFTADLVEQVNNGNLDGINEAFQTAHRASLRQALTMQAQMLQPVVANILQRVGQMIDGKMGSQQNEETLLEAFPSARDPKVRPVINGVFQQSLKHTKGNREAAVAMTKDMLRVLGKTASQDLGIEVPPGERNGAGDGALSSSESALIDELLGRS